MAMELSNRQSKVHQLRILWCKRFTHSWQRVWKLCQNCWNCVCTCYLNKHVSNKYTLGTCFFRKTQSWGAEYKRGWPCWNCLAMCTIMAAKLKRSSTNSTLLNAQNNLVAMSQNDHTLYKGLLFSHIIFSLSWQCHYMIVWQCYVWSGLPYDCSDSHVPECM